MWVLQSRESFLAAVREGKRDVAMGEGKTGVPGFWRFSERTFWFTPTFHYHECFMKSLQYGEPWLHSNTYKECCCGFEMLRLMKFTMSFSYLRMHWWNRTADLERDETVLEEILDLPASMVLNTVQGKCAAQTEVWEPGRQNSVKKSGARLLSLFKKVQLEIPSTLSNFCLVLFYKVENSRDTRSC